MPINQSRGRVRYVPPEVVNEIEDIKCEDKCNKDVRAFVKMVEYCRVGREVDRIAKFNFTHKPTSLKEVAPKKRRNMFDF